jgi:hypothetical protein
MGMEAFFLRERAGYKVSAFATQGWWWVEVEECGVAGSREVGPRPRLFESLLLSTEKTPAGNKLDCNGHVIGVTEWRNPTDV